MKASVFLSLVVLAFLVMPVIAIGQSFSPELSGERNLGDEYIFTVKNVTGLNQNLMGSDAIYHWSVYDYRVIGDHYTYWSVAWGQWFRQDADPGKKYLAVWVRSELKGNASWYGWGPERFRVWVWGNVTADREETPLQDLPVKLGSDEYRPVVIAELQDLKDRGRSRLTTEWYGWKDEIELDRQEPGSSAAWDGMILFQVPQDVTEDEIRVLGWSWYGYGVWYLTNHENLIQEKYVFGSDTRTAPGIQESKAVVIRGKDTGTKSRGIVKKSKFERLVVR